MIFRGSESETQVIKWSGPWFPEYFPLPILGLEISTAGAGSQSDDRICTIPCPISQLDLPCLDLP